MMHCRLIIPKALYFKAREHLLPESGTEGLIFFIAGKNSGENWLTLSVRDIFIPLSEDLVWSGTHGIELSDEAKVRVMLKARSTDLCLIEAHSHPGVRSNVTLSAYDWENAKEFVPYVHLKLRNRPYCALVFGQESVDGFVWLPEDVTPFPISEILLVGAQIEKVYLTSSNFWTRGPGPSRKFEDRYRGCWGDRLSCGRTTCLFGCKRLLPH